jgi:carbon storage regulator
MLVLSRARNEEIAIGRTIRVKVLKTGYGRVRLAISAPKDVRIVRAELLPGDSAGACQQEVSASPGAVAKR